MHSIMPDKDKLQFHNHKFYLDWTQEQKQSIYKYLCEEDHKINSRYWNHDTLEAHIEIDGKRYRLLISLMYIDYPTTIFKQSNCDRKSNWEQIRDKDWEDKKRWNEQHPDADFKHYLQGFKLTPKEQVPICPVQMPTQRIFYVDAKYRKP